MTVMQVHVDQLSHLYSSATSPSTSSRREAAVSGLLLPLELALTESASPPPSARDRSNPAASFFAALVSLFWSASCFLRSARSARSCSFLLLAAAREASACLESEVRSDLALDSPAFLLSASFLASSSCDEQSESRRVAKEEAFIILETVSME